MLGLGGPSWVLPEINTLLCPNPGKTTKDPFAQDFTARTESRMEGPDSRLCSALTVPRLQRDNLGAKTRTELPGLPMPFNWSSSGRSSPSFFPLLKAVRERALPLPEKLLSLPLPHPLLIRAKGTEFFVCLFVSSFLFKF